MKAGLAVQFERKRVALANIFQVHIKNLRKPWPKDVNAYFLKHRVEDSDPVDIFHLLLALFIDLDHDQAGVHVEQVGIHHSLQSVYVVPGDNLSKDAVEHVRLLGLVRHLNIEELEDEDQFLGNRIRDQFHLTTEYFLEQEPLVLEFADMGDYWVFHEERLVLEKRVAT